MLDCVREHNACLIDRYPGGIPGPNGVTKAAMTFTVKPLSFGVHHHEHLAGASEPSADAAYTLKLNGTERCVGLRPYAAGLTQTPTGTCILRFCSAKPSPYVVTRGGGDRNHFFQRILYQCRCLGLDGLFAGCLAGKKKKKKRVQGTTRRFGEPQDGVQVGSDTTVRSTAAHTNNTPMC
jgi:hypothetical protein